MSRTRINAVNISLVKARLRRPFVTAQGSRMETVNAAITLRLKGGASGYGEASTSIAQRHLTPAALRAALQSLGQSALGQDARDWQILTRSAWALHGGTSPAAAAFESALLEAYAAEHGKTLAQWFGSTRKRQETDVTISAWTDTAITAEAAGVAAADGFKLLKIKVGGKLSDDLARIRAVSGAAPKARLILDGNQGFTPRRALSFIDRVLKENTPVELFEQPTPKMDLRALAQVSRHCPIPVAADESVATSDDAARAMDAGVTAINIKLAKSGLSQSLAIAGIARAARRPLMIGCMAETARGLSASVHFALGTGYFKWADLDSDLLLVEKERNDAGWKRRGRFMEVAD